MSDKATALVSEHVARARLAQQALESAGQAVADTAVLAAAWALLTPAHNRQLSQMAVECTGLGNVEDKIAKNHRKTLGLLRDMQGVRCMGVVGKDPQNGVVNILRPIGVIGAVTPSTNPAATVTNNILNALKAGNAIIIAPSPKGLPVAQTLLGFIHAQMERAPSPLPQMTDLVQVLPTAEREVTQELMRQVDLLVVTGSQKNVRNGYTSGTPCLGVGAGNVTVIIDETADVPAAANKIAASKTFDNATSCSSENSVILVDANADTALKALQSAGGFLLEPDDKTRLQNALWQNGKLNPALIAKKVSVLIDAINTARASEGEPPLAIDNTANNTVKFLMVTEEEVGAAHPFSGEKMSPVLTVYRAADYPAAVARAEQILNHQGRGHSVGLHSNQPDRATDMGCRLPACRVILNQAHCFATGGAFDNALPFSLSMGCGAWGGNSFSGNFNFRHLSHQVQVVQPIKPREPTLHDIFAEYWQQVGADEHEA